MTEERYNGWTNYETWNVALWLGNEQDSDRYWREEAQDAYRCAEANKTFTRRERAAFDLAERLKEDIAVENQPELGASMYSDLLSAAISEVNWCEIAEHYIDDEADQIDKEEIEEAAE